MSYIVYLCPHCESAETRPVDRANDAAVDDISVPIPMTCDECGATFTNQAAYRYDMDTDYWSLGSDLLARAGKCMADLIREVRGE
jgi:hypothetical protein